LADQYSSSGPYEGENCLHIAIVNRNAALAKHLVKKCPELVHQRAIGEFFKAVSFLFKVSRRGCI